MIKMESALHSPNQSYWTGEPQNKMIKSGGNDNSEISMPHENLMLSQEAQEIQSSSDGSPEENVRPSLLSAIGSMSVTKPEGSLKPEMGAISTVSPVSNFLSMMLSGTVGLNGVTAGQNTWPGGGGVQSTEEYEDMIDSFSQGNKGNCSSVATIKAAMDTYGEDVFLNVNENPDGSCQVTMKDGVTVEISAKEMKIAEKMADFEGMEGEELDQAVLCYASMAKRAQMEQNDGSKTYAGACMSLNNGEWPDDTARFLGLEDYMMPVNPDDIQGTSFDSIVTWSSEHCVYVNNENGQYVSDHYGDEYAYDGTDTVGNDLEGAYTFV